MKFVYFSRTFETFSWTLSFASLRLNMRADNVQDNKGCLIFEELRTIAQAEVALEAFQLRQKKIGINSRLAFVRVET